MSGKNGKQAEQQALAYSQGEGLSHLASNYRSRFGEIDLIMRDKQTVIFVEVRMRASDDFGGAGASITPAKCKKIVTTAQHYLAELRETPPCRFDVVLLGAGASPKIEWIRNAFSAD